MKPKEVKKVLADNLDCSIYTRTAQAFVQLHIPTSKSWVIRNARHFRGFRVGTFLEERPDLDPKRICNGDKKIITFYM